MQLWDYVAIGAVALTLADGIVLLLLFLLGRNDAPPYWNE